MSTLRRRRWARFRVPDVKDRERYDWVDLDLVVGVHEYPVFEDGGASCQLYLEDGAEFCVCGTGAEIMRRILEDK